MSSRHRKTGTFVLAWLSGCAAVFAAPPPEPATGAKVDESRVARTYYVDAAGADAADDDKHGTQDSPFVTIRRAIDAAVHDKDANVGAKIIVAPGTYRESLHIGLRPGQADTDAPLVVEAAEHDQTVVDAADVVGWEAATWKSDGTALTHRWHFQKEKSTRATPLATPPGPEIYRRSELIFVDNVALRQVDAASTLTPGSFWISPETDHKGSGAVGATVRLRLPEGTDAAQAGFQVATRGYGLEIVGRRNVVIRGLVFQHSTSPAYPHNENGSSAQAGLGLTGCSNILIEDVLCQWNDGVGLYIEGNPAFPASTGITLRRVRLVHNGGSGLAVANLKNVLAEDCETSFNNFRGEWTGFCNPQGPAGIVANHVHGSTWRRQRAVANFSRGLRWETDCTDLLVEDGIVRANFYSGLLIDNCPGPSVVRGCFVADNKLPPGSQWERSYPAAVSVAASPDVTLENNVVAGNAMPQLGLWDVAERTDGVNFETGAKTTLRAERHAYRHNVFWGADAGQIVCDLPVADRVGKEDFAFYYGTLDSDENCFWNPALADVFCTYDRTSYRRPGLGLLGWRTFLLAHANAGGGGGRRPEAGSLWQDPLFMEPAEGDYRLQAQSPLIDWGLPSDEGAVAQ